MSRRGAPLDRRDDALIDLSAAIASRDADALGRSLRAAAALDEPAAVDEVILQSHLFVGYPVALEAMVKWRGLIHHRGESREPSSPAWAEQGSRTCRMVYGQNYEKLRLNVQALHPDLDRWMVETGYGRVLSRGGLSLAERELCIVGLLAVWDSPRQLHSHIRGALNAGASEDAVQAAIEVAGRYLDAAGARELERLWQRARPASSDV